MGTIDPSALHAAVATAFNRGDVEALVELYDESACLIEPGGHEARGRGEIRRVWADFVALGGQMTMVTRYCCVVGDTALLSNSWQFVAKDLTLGSTSAEVATRQSDGTWRYLVDNPMGGAHGAT